MIENLTNNTVSHSQIEKTLEEIILRLSHLEKELARYESRNVYDMTLYILVGMLIAFIIYSLLRK